MFFDVFIRIQSHIKAEWYDNHYNFRRFNSDFKFILDSERRHECIDFITIMCISICLHLFEQKKFFDIKKIGVVSGSHIITI